MAKENYVNAPAGAILTTAALSTDTTLTVNTTTLFPSTGQFRVICTTEVMIASVFSSTVLTVTRGQEGTTAVALASGLFVVPTLTDQSIRNLVRESLNGTNVSARRELNFIPGNKTGISLSDDATNDKVDITISHTLPNPPGVSDFAWLNQGAASVAAGGFGGIALSMTTNSGNSLRGLIKSVPGSTPYSVIVHLVPCCPAVGFYYTGIILNESATGKCITFGWGSDSAGSIAIYTWSSTTSSSGNPLQEVWSPAPRWLKYTDDGTNRSYYVSPDSLSWVKVLQHARATGFTSINDKVGIFLSVNNGTFGGTLLCDSYTQG